MVENRSPGDRTKPLRPDAPNSESTLFTLAHLSDPHLGPLPPARRRELAGKRLLGWLNWQRGRARRHTADTLRLIEADIARHQPDHVAVTGDLVNLALAAEFAPAAAWLGGLGRPDDVSVVPGNHDAYVARTAGLARLHWGDHMTGDRGEAGFPFVRRRGAVALVGVSSAVPSAPFLATGRLGPQQIEALAEALDALGREGACRILLIHHPPVGRFDFQKRLIDGQAVRAVLARTGAELVLHGHTHVPARHAVSGPRRPIPVIGVPSASAGPVSAHPAGWNRFVITDGGAAAQVPWRIELERRGLRHGGAVIETLERTVLAG
ncbi:metallophosphoesterase family protein [Blastochloris sulfoviridis]|uniref:metallophosphoesterase family protein n=1 Tax=Blastochloris sulfoviridis TaxID=50712 RepID=UPI001FE9B4B9|nr:metallophosphoesterase [Blastochloris sulfoviridis]